MCSGALLTLAARYAAAASPTGAAAEPPRQTETPASVEQIQTRPLADASAGTNPLTRTAA